MNYPVVSILALYSMYLKRVLTTQIIGVLILYNFNVIVLVKYGYQDILRTKFLEKEAVTLNSRRLY